MRSMINRIATTSAVLLAVGGVSLAAPSSAEEGCPNNITCTYAGGTDIDGGAYNTKLTERAPGTVLQNFDQGLRDRLSSWKNNSNTGAKFFKGLGGTGDCASMFANARASASAGNPDSNVNKSHDYRNRCV